MGATGLGTGDFGVEFGWSRKRNGNNAAGAILNALSKRGEP